MLRFVVLYHDCPDGHPRPSHWDFMLEEIKAATLRTWAVERAPHEPGPLVAESLGGHRLEYLEYEGPISGGRGHVRAYDRGTYELICEDDRQIVVHLHGEKLIGTAFLEQIAGDNAPSWTFTFEAEAPHTPMGRS